MPYLKCLQGFTEYVIRPSYFWSSKAMKLAKKKKKKKVSYGFSQVFSTNSKNQDTLLVSYNSQISGKIVFKYQNPLQLAT